MAVYSLDPIFIEAASLDVTVGKYTYGGHAAPGRRQIQKTTERKNNLENTSTYQPVTLLQALCCLTAPFDVWSSSETFDENRS